MVVTLPYDCDAVNAHRYYNDEKTPFLLKIFKWDFNADIYEVVFNNCGEV